MLTIACRELDRQFQRCSDDLDFIARKLENPAKLLERVKALERDLPKVQEDWRRVMIAKQTLIDVAKAQQLPNHKLLQQMCHAGELNLDEDTSAFTNFLKLEGDWNKENDSQISQLRGGLSGHRLLTPEELNMEVLRSAVIDLRGGASAQDDTADESDRRPAEAAQPCGGADPQPAAAAPPPPAAPSYRISEAEFLSVSNIVRGRCRVDECNELLDLIVARLRAPPGGAAAAAGAPLSTSELVKLGARVTGQTGGSRLATLRCLKRITITKDGVLLNPKWLPR